MTPRMLFVLALQGEDPQSSLHPFAEQTLITGVGKVNAAIALTRALTQRAAAVQTPVDDLLVVNLGSAGSHTFAPGTTVCARRFFERDMDARTLGFALGQTPFEEHVFLEAAVTVAGLPSGTCCTGDSFVSDAQATSRYDIIDMEAYALAKVCAEFGVPFASIKFITDGADEGAGEAWQGSVHRSAQALLEAVGLLQAQLHAAHK